MAELSKLAFADIKLSDSHAEIITEFNGAVTNKVVNARPGDPACPVAALKDLRAATHRKLRADRKNRAPTDAQIDASPVFLNPRTGKPLSRTGLTIMVDRECSGIADVPAPERGRFPALTADQRRQVAQPGCDPRTARALALIFHTAFAAARVGSVAQFKVGDVELWGHDVDGANVYTPLVDTVEQDNTVTAGILDRIAHITETDLLDEAGNSFHKSGLIMGIHNSYPFGTKTQKTHENWYPMQAGHPACPIRLLMLWLKAHDRLMVAKHGRRLSPHDPLFTSLKNPGEPISNLSRTLGNIVKTVMADLGLDPTVYSAHSLRKFRPSYALSQGASMTESMVHDGRSSEVTGLVYAHRNPRDPFSADPTIDIYKKASGKTGNMGQNPDPTDPTPHPHIRAAAEPSRRGTARATRRAPTGRRHRPRRRNLRIPQHSRPTSSSGPHRPCHRRHRRTQPSAHRTLPTQCPRPGRNSNTAPHTKRKPRNTTARSHEDGSRSLQPTLSVPSLAEHLD